MRYVPFTYYQTNFTGDITCAKSGSVDTILYIAKQGSITKNGHVLSFPFLLSF